MPATLVQFTSTFLNAGQATVKVTVNATAGSFLILVTADTGPGSDPAPAVLSASDGSNPWTILSLSDASAWAPVAVTGPLIISVAYATPANTKRQVGVWETTIGP